MAGLKKFFLDKNGKILSFNQSIISSAAAKHFNLRARVFRKKKFCFPRLVSTISKNFQHNLMTHSKTAVQISLPCKEALTCPLSA
jgi:hypothetical protein